MNRIRSLGLALALGVAVFATGSQAGGPPTSISRARVFVVPLTGAEEVPPVTTDASGIAIIRTAPDESYLQYTLITFGLENITASHIHLGPAGANGGVVAFLFNSMGTPVTHDGLLARGIITDDDLIGALSGQTVADLIDHIDNDNAYVNVHTTAHPSGEIRGQID